MPPTPTRADALAVLEGWKQVSIRVRRARETPFPSQVNGELDAFARDSSARFLTPTAALWAGDNLWREARFGEAHKHYGRLDGELKPIASAAQRLAALRRMGLCLERSGDVNEAVATIERARRAFPDHSAVLALEIARIHERNDLTERAAAGYQGVARLRGRDPDTTAAKATAARALQALRPDAAIVGSPIVLTRRLARGLVKQDVAALESLASTSQFVIGFAGAETAPADRARTLTQLVADLRASPAIQVDPFNFREKGDKLYLPTSGWNGVAFRGAVILVIERTQRGWVWNGMLGAGASDPKSFESLRTTDVRPSSARAASAGAARAAGPVPTSIADLAIKSPWPRGRFFRAGGLYKFVQEQLAVALAPWPINMAVLVGFASRACGFGPNGYYYAQGPTHSSTQDRYAIDFTSNRQNVAYAEISTGTPVLAVTIGIVTDVREYVNGGSATTDNHVFIDHYGEVELLAALIVAMTSGTLPRSRYSARYLHLDGPNQVPVSDGMFVEQGTILGTMDDTGNSSGSHLHFSMHRNDAARTGVRPTPMDGQTLNDGEDGKCMSSTNDPRV